ncbi:unnamed protein product, partial [Orchesella dallaii]
KIDNDNLFVPHASIRSRITIIQCMTCFKKELDRGNFRYSNTFNVVISPVENGKEYTSLMEPVEEYWDVLVPSRSLFIYVYQNNPRNYFQQLAKSLILTNWATITRNFAALKIIVRLPLDFKCSASKTFVTVICSEYCSSPYLTADDLRRNWDGHDFYRIHHSIYWNANGKHVPGVLALEESQKTFAKLGTLINEDNDEKTMTLLTLASTHNITFSFHRISLETRRRFQLNDDYTGLEAITSISFTSYCLCSIGQLHFRNIESFSVMYCPKIKADGRFIKTFGTWYRPFSVGVWITALTFVFSGIVALVTHNNYNHVDRVLNQLVTYFLWVSGGNIRPRHVIVTWTVVFILSQLYVNGLTSLVTVATLQQGFKSLKDFIDNNYKIVFVQPLTPMTVEELFDEEFKLHHLPIKKAFKVLKINYTNKEILNHSMKDDAKIGLLVATSRLKYHILYYNNFIHQNFSESYTCLGIDQTFRARQHHWYLKIESYHWLMISMQRLVQSGLSYRWDEWSIWHGLLKEKLLGQKTSTGPQYVDFGKVLALLIFLCCCMLISIVVFCLEIHSYI